MSQRPSVHRRASARVTRYAILAAMGMVFLVTLTPATPTGRATPAHTASPARLEDMYAQAHAVQARARRLQERLGQLTDQWRRARLLLDRCSAQLVATRARLARATAQLTAAQRLLSQRVSQMYKLGDYSVLDVVFASRSLTDIRDRARFLTLLGRSDDALVRRCATAVTLTRRAATAVQRIRAQRQRLAAAARSRVLAVRAQREDCHSQLAHLQKRLRHELAQRGAAQRGWAERAVRSFGLQLASLPPHSVRRAAVTEALRHLGVRYVYGGADPRTGFDCSGLVMYVYSKVGVRLPHFAAWQASQGTRVPFAALQPADLVFFGSPIHHVGMYVGDGRFIHAPHTGDVVRIALLGQRPDLTAACRYLPQLR